MTSYWRSTHTQSWPGSKVAEASSLLLLILSLYTSLQMAQKRRRKCISHLIYFEFCLDVQIASEWNRMQGKLLYSAKIVHTPHSVTTAISLHSSTSLIASTSSEYCEYQCTLSWSMSQLQNSTIYCAGAAARQLSPGCSWRSDFPASRLSPVSANVIAANKTIHVSGM